MASRTEISKNDVGVGCWPIIASLLQKNPVSGQEFLTAFVAGVEAECKLGFAVYPEHYNVGWHITSTTGSVGAAVAVGKILDLDVPRMQHAIGIASTQVVGMQEFFGSDTKSFHVGRAAQGGMLAALLAQNGYTSSLQALEAEKGWARVVSTRQNLTDEFGTLGKTWEITRNSLKPFPCGIVIHPTIDGCIQLRNQLLEKGLGVSSIRNVEARVNQLVLTLTGKTNPQTGLGKFSVYHAAAVGLLFGKATPTEFSDEVVKSETVVALRSKINTMVDDSVTEDEVYLKAILEDGTIIEQHIQHAIGSLEKPLTEEQLKTEFMDQASRAIGQDRAEKAYQAFVNIGNMTDVGKVGTAF